jgi:hypothetical protein
VQIQAGDYIITTADPLPGELRQAVEAISAVHYLGRGQEVGSRRSSG